MQSNSAMNKVLIYLDFLNVSVDISLKCSLVFVHCNGFYLYIEKRGPVILGNVSLRGEHTSKNKCV